MSTPKDYIVYIGKDNKTCAIIVDTGMGYDPEEKILADGYYKIIGYVSAGSEEDAIQYGDQVLR